MEDRKRRDHAHSTIDAKKHEEKMLLAKKKVGGGTVVLENISAHKENEEEVIVPMSWLNMQLKWVHNSDSMTVDSVGVCFRLNVISRALHAS